MHISIKSTQLNANIMEINNSKAGSIMAKSISMTVKKKNRYIVLLVIVIVVVLFFLIKPFLGQVSPDNIKINGSLEENSFLEIIKGDVTETVKFYSYSIDKTKLEVMAVRAPDGSIRTALNTCQVCYSSGRGYYVQNGTEVVCQNCGNIFEISQIEKIKGGCNPVPILNENKSEDDLKIIISGEFFDENKYLFLNWKK